MKNIRTREYMDISWGCGWFLATLFVVTNLIGQLGAVAMVLTRCNFLSTCDLLNTLSSLTGSRLTLPVAFSSSSFSSRLKHFEMSAFE